jgi:hypothetical protein
MFSINTLALVAAAKPVFALAKYAPADSFIIRKISHLGSEKMFRSCEDEIFSCSSTGLRDGDSLTVLFFRRYMTRN